jgi:Tfp pilus assembly protein FimT
MIKLKLSEGQSLFELVIAIGISALIIVVLVSLVSKTLANASFSKNETLAGRYAQAATEWLRGQRDNRIDTFMTNRLTPDWCLKDSVLTDASWSKNGVCNANDFITGTPFIRQVSFSSKLVSAKTIVQADVKVSWTDSTGVHIVTSATQFSDWRER